MKYLSQSHNSVTQWVVEKGDWAIDEDATPPFDPNLEFWDMPEAVPSSTEVDERTIKTRIFTSKKAAERYAEKIVESRKDDKWLAYVELKESQVKVIRKFK